MTNLIVILSNLAALFPIYSVEFVINVPALLQRERCFQYEVNRAYSCDLAM